jgi:hypothetical protein
MGIGSFRELIAKKEFTKGKIKKIQNEMGWG